MINESLCRALEMLDTGQPNTFTLKEPKLLVSVRKTQLSTMKRGLIQKMLKSILLQMELFMVINGHRSLQ